MSDSDDTKVRDLLPTTTIEQLRAWFSLPSFEDLEEAGVGAAPPEPTIQQERQAKVAEVLAHVQAHMVARYERHIAMGERLRPPELPVRPWENPDAILAVDESGRVPTDEEWREVEISNELANDLKACTPQAFLRDLYRPEKEFWIQMQPAFDDEAEPERQDPMGMIRATIRADYRVGAVHTPSVQAIRAHDEDRRALMRAPWAEAKREAARKREAELLGKEAATAPVPRSPEGPR